jgi:hypothetical protein
MRTAKIKVDLHYLGVVISVLSLSWSGRRFKTAFGAPAWASGCWADVVFGAPASARSYKASAGVLFGCRPPSLQSWSPLSLSCICSFFHVQADSRILMVPLLWHLGGHVGNKMPLVVVDVVAGYLGNDCVLKWLCSEGYKLSSKYSIHLGRGEHKWRAWRGIHLFKSYSYYFLEAKLIVMKAQKLIATTADVPYRHKVTCNIS